MSTERSTVVGVFEDRRHARLAVDELCRNGFTQEQIGFAMPEGRQVVDPPQLTHHTKGEEGAAAGVLAGGGVGGLVGAALATSVIPGIGPVIAGGLLVGIVTGAGTRMPGGGLLGTPIGLDVPGDDARSYASDLHSGPAVVSLQAADRAAAPRPIRLRAP